MKANKSINKALSVLDAAQPRPLLRRYKNIEIKMDNDKKSSTSTAISLVVGLIAFFVAKYGYQHFFGTKAGDLNKELVTPASQLNETLPMMVDSETRLDSTAGFNKTFRYNYTLVNYTSEELDPKSIEAALGEKLINSVCTTKEMEVFTKNSVPVSYAYHGKNGKQVTVITVSPSQCES